MSSDASVAGWVALKAAVGEDFAAKPSSVRESQGKDGKGKYYVVEPEGGGFVVTSGDTELNPVRRQWYEAVSRGFGRDADTDVLRRQRHVPASASRATAKSSP